MPYSRPNRRSFRSGDYDYRTPGAYFITVCAYQRQLLFDDPVLYDLVTTTWHSLPSRWPTIALDEFVVMPNHVHGIIWLNPPVGVGLAPARDPALIDIVRTYKSLVATAYLKWIRANEPLRSARVWQRNYYERIIRDECELHNIRQYIRNNPARWAADRDNLDAIIDRMRSVNH